MTHLYGIGALLLEIARPFRSADDIRWEQLQTRATADRAEGGIGRDRAADIKGPWASEKSAINQSKRASTPAI